MAETPGLPDPALIVGDWTGEVASRRDREAEAYREASRRLRSLHGSLAQRRQFWAEHSTDQCAAARAVAYQSVMSRINILVHDLEQIVEVK